VICKWPQNISKEIIVEERVAGDKK
jgi:hypothetical protein